MIDNTNQSKTASSLESSVTRYIGVASVNIVAINPNNEKLRKFGWQIKEDAEEQKYVTKIERNGRQIDTARICLLAQITDLEDKPIIQLNFFIRNEYELNKDGSKCKIIDSYIRTAWATKDDVKNKRIPQYNNGPASIAKDYTLCHVGEDTLLNFLFKYLNITPFNVFDRSTNTFVKSKNPGRLTIDDWNKLVHGDVSEIAEYISLQPDNCVKVILGIRHTEDNKTYQTFMTDDFISNGAFPNKDTGEYTRARKLIDKFMEAHENTTCVFKATPVKLWKEEATTVTDQSSELYTDESESFGSENEETDLPF